MWSPCHQCWLKSLIKIVWLSLTVFEDYLDILKIFSWLRNCSVSILLHCSLVSIIWTKDNSRSLCEPWGHCWTLTTVLGKVFWERSPNGPPCQEWLHFSHAIGCCDLLGTMSWVTIGPCIKPAEKFSTSLLACSQQRNRILYSKFFSHIIGLS